MGIMRKKPLKNNPVNPLKEPNLASFEAMPMDPDARAATLLERLDKLRKKVRVIRQDLEEIERDLLGHGHETPQP
jgi:hypothetical protein